MALASILLLCSSLLTHSQTNTLTQTIKGQFRITGVPIGRHTIQVSLVGYEPRQVTEIVVTSGKEVFISVPLTEKIQQLQNITVSGKRDRTKPLNEFATVSARSFTVEETKQYAAAAFDPGRLAQNFAGVSNKGDMEIQSQ